MGIGHVGVDDFGEVWQVGVCPAKNRQNLFGMLVVLGKDDGLAELLTVVDFESIGHQDMENLPDGIFIENPFIQGGGRNGFRYLTVFIPECLLINGLLIFGQFVVDNALLNKLQRSFHRQEIDQIAILDRLSQLIAVGRHAIFQLKHIIGIFINLIFGCGCQAHEWRIEIIEDVPVFVVDRTMCFVADNQVKMSAGEQLAFVILDGVDAVHHRLVGGKHTVGIVVVLVLAEIGDGQVRQQIGEAAFRLCDQRIAIGEEEDVFHPTAMQEDITKANDCSRFARAGGHDQQGFAAVAPIETVTDGLDRSLLVITTRDVLFHPCVLESGPHRLQVEELLQIALGIDAGNLSLGITVVHQTYLKTIGKKNDRAAMVLLFQQVGVELGLLPALGDIDTGTLSFDHCQGPAIVTIEHIIGITNLRWIGHPGQLDLIEPVAALCPASVHQHGIDVDLASFVLGQLQRLGHIGLLLHLAPSCQFGFEGAVFRDQGLEIDLRSSGGNR